MSFCLFVLFAILDYMSIVEMNKKEKLSPHFTLGEMTKTSHRTADGNIPSHVAIENLKRLCGWLEMPSRYRESEASLWLAGDAIEGRGSTVWVHFAVRPKGNRRKTVFDIK